MLKIPILVSQSIDAYKPGSDGMSSPIARGVRTDKKMKRGGPKRLDIARLRPGFQPFAGISRPMARTPAFPVMIDVRAAPADQKALILEGFCSYTTQSNCVFEVWDDLSRMPGCDGIRRLS
jgi:hypothetical protein